jgi:hypothetical protein
MPLSVATAIQQFEFIRSHVDSLMLPEAVAKVEELYTNVECVQTKSQNMHPALVYRESPHDPVAVAQRYWSLSHSVTR